MTSGSGTVSLPRLGALVALVAAGVVAGIALDSAGWWVVLAVAVAVLIGGFVLSSRAR